ncbi:MAG: arylsulfatase [Acidobacteria bacterium]|nr:arylsulfatase [Acidobacteriota bacterium]
MLRRREFLSALALPALAQTRKPNVVFIIADDLGYGDRSCYGQAEIQTPNLDRMAAEGTRFTQAYAGCTVCAPSRCALMTGLHTGHCRIRGNTRNEELLQAGDFVISEMFKKAGYKTGIFGKWGIGGLGFPGYPTKKGWDEWFGYLSQRHAHTYYPEHLLDGNSEHLVNENFGARKKGYAPDLFLARALQFIEKHKEEPFFLYFSNPIPHANNELGRDTGDGIEVPEDAPYSSKPWPALERKFAATVTRLDRDVQKILDKLDNNTLVIFTSDNGPHKEGGHDAKFFKSSGPLNGTKRDLTDGGIRVPFIARWPGKLPAGRTSDHPFAFWDMMPTLADVIGATAPKNIDGISMYNALLGKPAKVHDYFYWEFHEGGFSQALRAGDWKLIRTKGKTLLFDLKTDLGETKDLAASQPETVARLTRLMDGARTESLDFPVKR